MQDRQHLRLNLVGEKIEAGRIAAPYPIAPVARSQDRDRG
jgi:hypothetical protein